MSGLVLLMHHKEYSGCGAVNVGQCLSKVEKRRLEISDLPFFFLFLIH